MTLVAKNEFKRLPERLRADPPDHTLKADLRRIWGECGYAGMAGAHTGSAQIPGTARHWPRSLSRFVPSTFSDNLLVIGRRPADGLGPVVDRRGD